MGKINDKELSVAFFYYHYQEKHSKDVASLTTLMNSTRMEMMYIEARMWKSVNSTGKKGDKGIWVALNNTKMDLQQKVRKVTLT